MPVGFPATETGVELRLLKHLFTPEQARIALGLDYKFRSAEQILAHIPVSGLSVAELEIRLEEMADWGNTIVKKKDGIKEYANIPWPSGCMNCR